MSELLDRALEAIRARRPALRARGIELLGVVGSVARRQERPDSDVDVAYDVIGRSSLLALSRALIDLEADLGRRVDLVDISRVEPELQRELEGDLIRA